MQALQLLFTSDFGILTVIFFAIMLGMGVYYAWLFGSRSKAAQVTKAD